MIFWKGNFNRFWNEMLQSGQKNSKHLILRYILAKKCSDKKSWVDFSNIHTVFIIGTRATTGPRSCLDFATVAILPAKNLPWRPWVHTFEFCRLTRPFNLHPDFSRVLSEIFLG